MGDPFDKLWNALRGASREKNEVRIWSEVLKKPLKHEELELRRPEERPLKYFRPETDAEAAAFFSGCAVIAREGEASWLASRTSDARGRCRVFWWHPDEWRLEPGKDSVAGWLGKALGRKGPAPAPGALPSGHDPRVLFRRSRWLLQIVLGLEVEDAKTLLKDAAPLARYRTERTLLATHPHLAAYWLWAHHLLGNEASLRDALAATATSNHPAVRESRDRLSSGRPRLGDCGPDDLSDLRERFRTEGPRRLFETPPAKPAAAPAAEGLKEILARLRQAAKTDENVSRALCYLETLEKWPGEHAGMMDCRWGTFTFSQYQEGLEKRIDGRFRDLILPKLKASLALREGHPKAAPGLIRAWGKIAKDFPEFMSVLREAGMGRLGEERRQELHHALARYDDPGAVGMLAEAAERWLKNPEDADTAPVRLLLNRPGPATERLVVRILAAKEFDRENYFTAVQACEAARRFKIRKAVAGLKRAAKIDGDLGPAAKKALAALR